MNKTALSKHDLLCAMALHVLEHGLNTASLRPLAKAAKTSDRMLIYHFGSKEELVTELLHFLAADLAERLDNDLPTKRAKSNRSCLSEIVVLLRRPPYSRHMKLWLDIVSAAGQGSRNHIGIGHAMISGFLEWLEKRVPAHVEHPRQTVCLMLTLIEGVLVMDAVGQSETADAAIEAVFND